MAETPEQSSDVVAARLADIRQRLADHIRAGRYPWDCFDCDDVEFLLELIDEERSG